MKFSSRSRVSRTTGPSTMSSRTSKSKSKRSVTPYDRGFEQHLTDHGVYPEYKSQKPDLESLRAALALPTASLSPSGFSEGAFEAFQESNNLAKNEKDVKVHIIPSITGPRQAVHPTAMNTLFGNLDPLTDGTLPPAKPDVYFGAPPEDLHRRIRDDLAGHIIPSTMEDKPMAPNFFLEAKGPRGDASVAALQARYDGAIGARAMHILQSYGEEEPKFDGHVYAFSSTYLDGRLRLYAHHVTGLSATGQRPEYHMTLLRGFDMMDSRERFLEGATAFRNARDLARSHRDEFIRGANARICQADIDAGMSLEVEPLPEETRNEESNMGEHVRQNGVVSTQIPHTDDTRPPVSDVMVITGGSDATDPRGLEMSTTLATISSGTLGSKSHARSKRDRVFCIPPLPSQPQKKHACKNAP